MWACPTLSLEHAELWIKNDGLAHSIYGGNKVRKAERLIAEALRRGARRVLSVGAAGSHHLLTLALFARAAGLKSAAVMFPQPHTLHALETLRAALGLGLEAHAARHPLLIPWTMTRAFRPGDYIIGPGGSNAVGSDAYADAIDELVQQIEGGALPTPDLIVVPLGSGGTCAGLAAGLVRRSMPCRVLGVQVVAGAGPRLMANFLARRVLRREGSPHHSAELRQRLTFDESQVGPGYGKGTETGAHATLIARELGLELDPTYTAKAFAKVLDLLNTVSPFRAAEGARPLRILYWHTLSARPIEPLLRGAPTEAQVPPLLRELLR